VITLIHIPARKWRLGYQVFWAFSMVLSFLKALPCKPKGYSLWLFVANSSQFNLLDYFRDLKLILVLNHTYTIKIKKNVIKNASQYFLE